MDLLRDMKLFVTVAKAKSFIGAAKSLGMPVSSLSRRISELEASIGVQLFSRSTRKLELTEAGTAYFLRCNEIVEAAETAHEALRQLVDKPQGTLRVSATADFATVFLSPLFVKFAQIYPDVRFEFDLSPRQVDLIAEGFDVAIRVGELPDSSLTARRIAESRLGLFAAREHLDRAGRPRIPADLARHDCIRILKPGQTTTTWTLFRGDERVEVEVHGRFAINNIRLILQLTADGMGIGAIDETMALADLEAGRIERVLPAWRFERRPIWALTPSRLVPAKTRLFLDCLSEHIVGAQERVARLPS